MVLKVDVKFVFVVVATPDAAYQILPPDNGPTLVCTCNRRRSGSFGVYSGDETNNAIG
jgi:hypothetical protein